jgi:hypothetical protein
MGLNRCAAPLALLKINVLYLPRPYGRGYFLSSLRDSVPLNITCCIKL